MCVCETETCERRVEITVSCVQLVGIQLNYEFSVPSLSPLYTQEEFEESRCCKI